MSLLDYGMVWKAVELSTEVASVGVFPVEAKRALLSRLPAMGMGWGEDGISLVGIREGCV